MSETDKTEWHRMEPDMPLGFHFLGLLMQK